MMALPLSLYALALQIHINPSLWLLSAAGNAGDARVSSSPRSMSNRTLSVVQAVLSGLVPGGADRSCRRPLSWSSSTAMEARPPLRPKRSSWRSQPHSQHWRRGGGFGCWCRPHFAGGRLRDRVDDADFRADLGRRPMARSEARRSARSLADDARAAQRTDPGKPEGFRHLASRRRVTVPMSRASPLSPACRHQPRAATAQGSDCVTVTSTMM